MPATISSRKPHKCGKIGRSCLRQERFGVRQKGRANLFLPYAYAIPPRSLCVIQGEIRRAKKCFTKHSQIEVARDLGRAGNANADCQVFARAGFICDRARGNRALNGSADMLRTSQISIWQDHNEFLPAEARNTIARPADRLLYDPADLMQRAITGKMTKAVIEMFEIIYVDQGDRKRPFFSTATAHFGADEALHAPPIGKAGQRVRFRQFLQFGLTRIKWRDFLLTFESTGEPYE